MTPITSVAPMTPMRIADLALGTPQFLLALVGVVALGVYLVWRQRERRDPALRFSAGALVSAIPRTAWQRIAWLPDGLRVLALALLALALARPQGLGTPEADDSEGIDIVLALDTSCSMRAADFQPNDRMFVAKKAIADFVKTRTTDRIGLVVFAGEAASWVPLTLDYSLVAKMLDEIEIGMLPDGTAIGSALGTALNRLRESSAKSRVVLLLTDGDSNAGSISPLKASELAKSLGVVVYTILIGRGGPVPYPAGKDVFGRVVYREQLIPINPALLKQIADATGGAAYQASDKEELDSRLVEVLDNLDKTRLEGTLATAPKEELFPILVLFGLVLIVVELALGSTRLSRFP